MPIKFKKNELLPSHHIFYLLIRMIYEYKIGIRTVVWVSSSWGGDESKYGDPSICLGRKGYPYLLNNLICLSLGRILMCLVGNSILMVSESLPWPNHVHFTSKSLQYKAHPRPTSQLSFMPRTGRSSWDPADTRDATQKPNPNADDALRDCKSGKGIVQQLWYPTESHRVAIDPDSDGVGAAARRYRTTRRPGGATRGRPDRSRAAPRWLLRRPRWTLWWPRWTLWWPRRTLWWPRRTLRWLSRRPLRWIPIVWWIPSVRRLPTNTRHGHCWSGRFHNPRLRIDYVSRYLFTVLFVSWLTIKIQGKRNSCIPREISSAQLNPIKPGE